MKAEALTDQPDLIYGFSTRQGGVSTCYREGDLNLGYTTHDDPANIRENRTRFLRALNAENFQHFGLLKQVHGTHIHTLTKQNAAGDFLPSAQHEGDGLITNVPGILLTIQVADCVPVLLFDPHQRAVGAFHAGWRGTLARIVEHGVRLMQTSYNSNPADILAAIGPSIGPQSYAVSEDLRTQFAAQFDYAAALFTETPQLHLNLWEANRRQLLVSGVTECNITVLEQDTATNTDRFFSYRAENGRTGRMMAAIGLSQEQQTPSS